MSCADSCDLDRVFLKTNQNYVKSELTTEIYLRQN